MTLPINQIATFGDARRMLLDTISDIRNGSMEVGRGMAVAALMKEVNGSIQAEINQAKMVILAQKEGHNFGRMVGMGQKLIGNSGNQEA
jgi:hypothetical protein